MKLKPFIVLIFLISFIRVNSQANLLNARVPQDVGQLNEQQILANNQDPLEYGYVDDRDVLWSKTVWEIIDLDERINFPYYYPTDIENLGEDRRSLWHILTDAIKNREIKEVYKDPYFREKQVGDDIRIVYIDTTDYAKTEFNRTGVWLEEGIDRYEISAKYVREYRIKGTWYVDKRLGELKYRLLGLCPVVVQGQDIKAYSEGDIITPVPLFWIWFPDARKSLNKHKVFNSKNSSQPVTYDHMLNSRRFNSTIYKEENIYEDRLIKEYIREDALKALLEAERIKSIIRDFEQDLWNTNS
jgi:gliding motility associated protien GldN